MADVLTFTAADIEAAVDAVRKNPNVVEIRIGDRITKFGPWQDAEARIAFMRRNIAGGTTGGVRYASTSKGF